MEFHSRPGKDFGLVYNDGILLVGVIERRDSKDRPPVVRVVISNPIDNSFDRFLDYSCLSHSHMLEKVDCLAIAWIIRYLFAIPPFTIIFDVPFWGEHSTMTVKFTMLVTALVNPAILEG